MPSKLRACRPGDPSLRPNWRQLRAQEAIKVSGRRSDDELVNAYCDYLEHGHAGKHQVVLEAALELRQLRHADQCSELEARVLSRQPLCEVAKSCGLTEEVVAAFCDWFFDVRDRLSARDWVTSQVLVSREADNPAAARLHGLWKRVGYFGGTLALEPLLAVSKSLPIPDEFLTAKGSARQEQELCLRSQIALTIAINLATTPDDWQKVAEMHAALRQRSPDSVSEIPAVHWMILGGLKGTAKNPKASPTTEKPTTTSSSTRSSIRNAILAALLP